MAFLERSVNIGDSPLYTVVVNDTNPNAEFSGFTYQIAGSASGISPGVVESAVQAFANSLAGSNPTFAVASIKKTIASEVSV